jgi:hypothetical protein
LKQVSPCHYSLLSSLSVQLVQLTQWRRVFLWSRNSISYCGYDIMNYGRWVQTSRKERKHYVFPKLTTRCHNHNMNLRRHENFRSYSLTRSFMRLLNLGNHYHICKCSLLVHALSQPNPVHILSTCLFNINSDITSVPSGLSSSGILCSSCVNLGLISPTGRSVQM